MSSTEGIGLVIIFIALVLSFGVLYTPAASIFTTVEDSLVDQKDELTDIDNISFDAEASSQGDTITVTVSNTGSETIHFSDLYFIVDGEYVSADASSVDGNTDRSFMMPTEQAEFEIQGNPQSENIRVTHKLDIVEVSEIE